MKFSNELKKKIELKNVEKMIERLLDLSKYVTDVRAERRKQGKGTSAEFFTPYTIITLFFYLNRYVIY